MKQVNGRLYFGVDGTAAATRDEYKFVTPYASGWNMQFGLTLDNGPLSLGLSARVYRPSGTSVDGGWQANVANGGIASLCHPRRGVTFEVQLAIDFRKHFSWPSYLVAARARHRCDAMLIVVSTDIAVAKWARQPVTLGPGSGFVQPIVIGPREMPSIVSEALALEVPELAVLSAVAHPATTNSKAKACAEPGIPD